MTLQTPVHFYLALNSLICSQGYLEAFLINLELSQKSIVCFVSFKLYTPRLIKVQELTATVSHGDLPKIRSQIPTVHAHELSLIINFPNGIFQLPPSLLSCLTSKLKTKIIFWEAPLKRLLILDFQLVLSHRITEWSELEGSQKDHRVRPLSKWPIGVQTLVLLVLEQPWCYLCLALHENREVKKCYNSFSSSISLEQYMEYKENQKACWLFNSIQNQPPKSCSFQYIQLSAVIKEVIDSVFFSSTLYSYFLPEQSLGN